MRFQSSAAFWAYIVSFSFPLVNANQGLRRKLASKDCTIMAAERLIIEPSGEDNNEIIIQCEMHSEDANGIEGIFLELDVTDDQRKNLKGLIKSGEVTPGQDTLDIVGKSIENEKIKFPPGLDIATSVKKNTKNKGRRLAVTKGEKPILLVKVKDVNGLQVSDTHEVMSNKGKIIIMFMVHGSYVTFPSLLLRYEQLISYSYEPPLRLPFKCLELTGILAISRLLYRPVPMISSPSSPVWETPMSWHLVSLK